MKTISIVTHGGSTSQFNYEHTILPAATCKEMISVTPSRKSGAELQKNRLDVLIDHKRFTNLFQ
jgi:hypothetical protein